MFADSLAAALRHAHYELIEDGTYFGAIDAFPGSWSNGPTLEECQKDMEADENALAQAKEDLGV